MSSVSLHSKPFDFVRSRLAEWVVKGGLLERVLPLRCFHLGAVLTFRASVWGRQGHADLWAVYCSFLPGLYCPFSVWSRPLHDVYHVVLEGTVSPLCLFYRVRFLGGKGNSSLAFPVLPQLRTGCCGTACLTPEPHVQLSVFQSCVLSAAEICYQLPYKSGIL